jgi:hypothetical protein
VLRGSPLLAALVSLALSAACITVRDTERVETGRSIARSERGIVRPAAPPDLDVRFEQASASEVALSVRGTQRCVVARRDVVRIDGTVERELDNHVPHLWIAGGFAATGAAVALGGSFLDLQIARQIAWVSGGVLVGAGIADALYVGTMALFAVDGEWSSEEVQAHSDEEACDPVARGLRLSLRLAPGVTTTGGAGRDGRATVALPAAAALVPQPPDALVLSPDVITGYAVPDDGAATQFTVPPPLREAAPVVALYAQARALQQQRVDEVFARWKAEHGEAYEQLRVDGGALLDRYQQLRGEGELLTSAADPAARAALQTRAAAWGQLLDDLGRLLVSQLSLPRPALARLPGLDPRLASVEAATAFTERVKSEHEQLTAFLRLQDALDDRYEACSGENSARAAQAVRAAGGALLWPGPDETNTQSFVDAVHEAAGCRTTDGLEAIVHAAGALRPRLLRERESCAATPDAEERDNACRRAALLARATEAPPAALVDVELSFLIEAWRSPAGGEGTRALIEEVMTSGAYRRADGPSVKRYLDGLAAMETEPSPAAD